MPLTVVASPYREITRPVVQYVKQLRRESPRDIVTVFIPEYVLGHWWEQVLHNQSALRLKARLLQQRGVVVASVPYQLKSATQAAAAAGLPWKAALPPLRRLTAGREELHAAELQAEIDERTATPIGDCPDREVADVAGILRSVTLRPRGPSLTMEADLWDGTGHVTLIWLGRRNIPGIQPGRRIMVHGRVARIKGERTIYNPVYELQPAVGRDRRGRPGLSGPRPLRAGTGSPCPARSAGAAAGTGRAPASGAAGRRRPAGSCLRSGTPGPTPRAAAGAG